MRIAVAALILALATGALVLLFLSGSGGDPDSGPDLPESAEPESSAPGEPDPVEESEAPDPEPTGGGIVTGVVRDPDTGLPVPDATVNLVVRSGIGHDRATQTAEDGTYRFEGIPVGEAAWPWVARTVGVEPVSRGPRFRRAAGFQYRLKDGSAHEFTAVGEVFRRDLEARWTPWRKQTFLFRFPDGAKVPQSVEYRAPLVPGYPIGKMAVAALDPDDPQVTVGLLKGRHSFRFTAGPYFGEVPDLRVTGDTELPPIEVAMRDRDRVFVQLTDKAGAPVRRAGVVVKLTVRGPERADHMGEAVTDAEGRAHVSHLMLSREESDIEGRFIHVNQGGPGVLEVKFLSDLTNLVLPGSEYVTLLDGAGGADLVIPIRFREFFPLPILVVDRKGNPVSGVRFRCESEKEDKTWFLEEEVVSRADGYILPRLLFFPLKGWSPWAILRALPPWSGLLDDREWSAGRFLQDDPPRKPRVVVYKVRQVRFRVTDDEGRTEADLTAVPNHRSENSVKTDADGKFVLPLPEGELTLPLAVGGIWVGDVAVPAGDPEVPVVLPARWQLPVSMVVPAELAEEDSFGFRWESSVASASTGLNRSTGFAGEITVRGDPVKLTVTSPDRRFDAAVEVHRGSGVAVLTLERRRLHPVTIRFVDADGQPVEELEVRFRRGMSQDISAFTPKSVITNSDGVIEVSMPAGKYFGLMRLPDAQWLDRFHQFEVPVDGVLEFRVRKK